MAKVKLTRDISYLPEEDYNDDGIEEKGNSFREQKRGGRNLLPEYRTLCETRTKRVQLDDAEFEYQPPHYHEVFCKDFGLSLDQGSVFASSQQKCAHPGFHCVQRSRTLYVVRRHWDSDCWEPFTKEIASGCDCMWPVSVLGEISPHY
ncbi:uncharacterized protein LOC105699947 [Orussus abietinus]|uniref:uncharacterized protein LOC105699947 n=1 Tax=Orussus abietinus TaxID=222816 RepID=UPI00062619AD|nr:uncharacterized protein LOC105699947 [Orussus abietinus]